MMNEAKKLIEEKNMNVLRKNVMGKSRINLIQLFEKEEKFRWFLIYDDIEYLFPKTKDEFNDTQKLKEMTNKCYNDKISLNWDIKEININIEDIKDINNIIENKELKKEIIK